MQMLALCVAAMEQDQTGPRAGQEGLWPTSMFWACWQVLVVTPTSDGNSVDVEYEASNERLDAWARQHGAPSVSCSPPLVSLIWQPGMRIHHQQRLHSLVASCLARR